MDEKRTDRELQAAEYALGTLERDGRREAEARMASDPRFAREVADWQDRLAPLARDLPPVQPPPEVWRRIEATLPSSSEGIDLAAAGRRFWQRIAFWRWCSFGASAVAAALALYIVATPSGQLPQTRYLAVLEAGPGQPAWLVSVDLTAQRLTVRPFGELAGAEGAYELWFLPGPDSAPQSLGLLRPETDLAIPINTVLSETAPRGGALAVSLEPAGGSPSGLPTGPVLFQGHLQAVTD